MSENTSTETTETTDTAPEATYSPQTDETTDPGTEDQNENPGREAAKYRRQLRDVESERDALTERVLAFQKAEAERIAGDHLERPAGLWANGAQLADVLDDDGNVSADKVKEAADDAHEALGIARPLGGNYVPSEGSNPRPTSGSGSPSFSDAFKPQTS